MKLKDVKIGGRYTAKVSGRIVVVRVVAIEEKWTSLGKGKMVTRIRVYNEKTGRTIELRSPQRLRMAVDDEHLGYAEKANAAATLGVSKDDPEAWAIAASFWQKALAVAPERYRERYQDRIRYAMDKHRTAAQRRLERLVPAGERDPDRTRVGQYVNYPGVPTDA